MNSETQALTHDPIQAIQLGLQGEVSSTGQFSEFRAQMRDIADSARDASRPDLARFAELLAGLLEIAETLTASGEVDESRAVTDFVRDSLHALQEGLEDHPDSASTIERHVNEANQRWGDILQLIDFGDNSPLAVWLDADGVEDEAEFTGDGTDGACQNIGLILSTLSETPAAREPDVVAEYTNAAEPPSPNSVISDENVVLDSEIKLAYLDDAQRCLAAIEESLLRFENDPDNRQPLRQVCRELHTLKGASASVGLAELASYLHQVEDQLDASTESEGEVDVEPILQAVDKVRQRTQSWAPTHPTPTTTAPAHEGRLAPAVESFVESASATQDSVRVKAAQLDRLMDMLAELVMLRNRRESRVEQLKEVQSELVRCVSRLRAYDERLPVSANGATGGSSTTRRNVSSLAEIASDLLDLGRNVRELYEPVAEENLAISRFTRHFRQELMQLRRVPVGGLFRRLQRAARDAARSEGKKVRLNLVGEEVGLERSIQEQLYEPLLHMVRNAVSHGIELESLRVSQGKRPEGTVTLEAHSGSNLLVITVRDDGRGLDYDALRRRGIEMGLLSIDRPASRGELAQLIFHPGFSTRATTSEISGRGVGMEVVAATLERMHSWVEVDSSPGEGTSIRLMIPLQSVIEHVMVFRAGGQEFAVPTQFVRAIGPRDAVECDGMPSLRFGEICPRLDSRPSETPQVVVLSQGWNVDESTAERNSVGSHDSACQTERRLALIVDEIVGPEEVVVRPLPGMLRNNRLFGGVTLSGAGDIMLIFDSQRLVDRGLRQHGNSSPTCEKSSGSSPFADNTEARRRALVVDDSRSSRRAISQLLTQYDFAVEEAADGQQALKCLKSNEFDVVFSDLEMPNMDGMELLKEVKSNPMWNDMPFVIVSSRDEEEFQAEAAALGVARYIVKPITDESLRSTLTILHELEQRNHP